MATYLLGAQEGAEEAFASLYELTNPVLLRYLRVVSDGNPADLALTSWATLVRRIPSSRAEDEAWLEQALGVARLSAEDTRQRAQWSAVVDPDLHKPFLVLADLEAPTRAPGQQDASTAAEDAPAAVREPDALDQAIDALRSLPPAEADALAMRGITRIGRSAISRLTGHDAAAVVALLDQARSHVSMSHHTLLTALRGPARPDELADLPVVLRLYAGVAPAPAKPAAVAAAAVAPLAAVVPKPAVDLFNWEPPATRAARRAGAQATQGAHHSAWGIATAAAGVAVIGGVAAAAFTGLLPFGDSESPRPAAQAPPRPSPSGDGGPTPTTPGPSTPGDDGAAPQPPAGSDTDDRFGPASLDQPGIVVVVPAFVPPQVPTPPTPPVVSPPPVAPPPSPPVVPPPTSPPPTTPPPPKPDPEPTQHPGKGHAYAYGKGHPKHSNGKGHAYARGRNGTQPGKTKHEDRQPGASTETAPSPGQTKGKSAGRT